MSNPVPDGWQQSSLNDVSTNITKGTTPTTNGYQYTKSGVKFLRVENISHGGTIIESDLKYINDEANNALRRSQLNAGDLLVSIAGAIGRSAIVEEKNLPANTNQAVGIVRLESNEVNANYVRYSIDSPMVERQMSDLQAGNAQVNLNLQQLGGLTFLRPSLPEQQKIAAILTSVDNVIESTQAQIDKLKDLKTGMMQELLTKGIGHSEFKDSPVGRIPVGWEVKPLGEVVSLTPGYAFSSGDFMSHGVPLIRMGSLYMNRLDLSRAPVYMPDIFVEKHRKFAVYAGDIVFSMTGTSGKEDYGFAVQIPMNTAVCMLNQRVAKIDVGEKVNTRYLLHLLHSRLFLDEIYAVGTGTKQANLSSSNILSVELPFPSLNEQVKIAYALDSVVERFDSLGEKVKSLQSTKKALMQDLLTGKVRVKVD